MQSPSKADGLRLPGLTADNQATTNKLQANRALSQLYQQHAKSIVGYLQRNYGFGPPEPEDVVQEVFAKFGEYQQLHYIDNPKAYLYKMAVNLTLNAIKRVKRMHNLMQQQMTNDEEPLTDADPESITARHNQLAALGEAINLLSDKQREILIRSRLKGETYAQISKALGWSQADICRQLYAALAILQQTR